MTFRNKLLAALILQLVSACAVYAQNPAPPTTVPLEKPLYKPFIERYILDELRQLRRDFQGLEAEISQKVAAARLDASDRAIRYTADTTNNIFFVITAAASILVLLGWRSLRDVRENIEVTVEKRISALTEEYEKRLNELENKAKFRSEQILAAQEKISRTNQIHSLWMRAGLESNLQEKINIYDSILEIQPEDVEAMAYKADALLDLGEARWALSLCDSAIHLDEEYAYAYWQRACVEAELNFQDEAMEDIRTAINKSPALGSEILLEKAFEGLSDLPAFIELVEKHTEKESAEAPRE